MKLSRTGGALSDGMPQVVKVKADHYARKFKTISNQSVAPQPKKKSGSHTAPVSTIDIRNPETLARVLSKSKRKTDRQKKRGGAGIGYNTPNVGESERPSQSPNPYGIEPGTVEKRRAKLMEVMNQPRNKKKMRELRRKLEI